MFQKIFPSDQRLLEKNQTKILAAFRKSCYVSEVSIDGKNYEKAGCHLVLFEEKIRLIFSGYLFTQFSQENSHLVDTLQLYAVLSGVSDPDIGLTLQLYQNDENKYSFNCILLNRP